MTLPKTELFVKQAPRLMAMLMLDFGLSEEDAAAIMGNAGHESGGFRLMQELKPRGGGRGGLGIFQWTGPRRVAFEAWLKRNNTKATDFDASYAFLFRELKGAEKKAIEATKSAVGLYNKVVAFERAFERAAADAKHYDSRMAWAQLALSSYQKIPVGRPVVAKTISPVPIALPEKPAEKPVGGLTSLLKRLWGHSVPPPVTVPPAAAVVISGADPLVLQVQKRLQELGYNEFGLADGIMGPKTGAAILTFRAEQNPALPADAEVNDDLLVALAKAKPREINPVRATATATTLREGGSKTVESFDAIGFFGKMLFGGGVLGGVDQTGVFDTLKTTASKAGEVADTASSVLQSLTTFITGVVGAVQWCAHHWWAFALGGGLYVLYKVSIGVLDLVIKFRTGILQRPSV